MKIIFLTFYIKTFLDCFVPRNDGIHVPSLRGTKQSRQYFFYSYFSFFNEKW